MEKVKSKCLLQKTLSIHQRKLWFHKRGIKPMKKPFYKPQKEELKPEPT